MNKKLFSIILSVFLLIPSLSYAICEGEIVPCGGDKGVCNFCHIFELTNNIIIYMITCLVPIISGVMLILGGFYFMIAGVDPEKMQKGKDIIKAAIIGLVVIFISWILLNTFLTNMGIAEWTGLNPESGDNSWWQIRCDVN